MAVINGTSSSEILVDTPENDSIFGLDGDDYIFATSGGDTVDGGSGNDSIEVGQGNNLVFGGDGSDRVSEEPYSSGNDTIFGGDGNDTLIGGKGNDTLSGGNGNDSFDLNSYNYILMGAETLVPIPKIHQGTVVITDFQQFNFDPNADDLGERDLLILSKSAYSLNSDLGIGFSDPSEFEVVANDTDAAFSDALITFSRDTGNLFYNENRAAGDFGNGSQLATLVSVTDLTTDSFQISY